MLHYFFVNSELNKDKICGWNGSNHSKELNVKDTRMFMFNISLP